MMTMKGRLGLACIVVVVGGLNAAYGEDTPEIVGDLPVIGICAVRCEPDTYLDDATCACVEIHLFKQECMLVCPKAWQQIDTLNCRCLGTNPEKEPAN